MATRIGGMMKALQNIHTALLYGKYDSIIVQDSE